MKKPIYKKWWFWVLLFVVIAIIGGGIGGTSENSSPSNNNVVVGESTVPPSETAETNTNNGVNPPIVKLGEYIETRDYKIDVVSAKTYTNDFLHPNEGNEYLAVEILIENISNDEISVSSMLCFNAYVDDFAVDLEYVTPESSNTLDGTVASGKKLQGVLCYQLPIGWETLEIDVAMNLFSDGAEVKILIDNN